MRALLISGKVINEDGTPKQRLIALTRTLTRLNILPELPQFTLSSINYAFQSHLLRKNGMERWHLPEFTIESSQEAYLQKALAPLGLEAEELLQEHVFVDYILVYGARFQTVEKRVKEITRLINQNLLGARKVALLTGNRPIPRNEEYDTFLAFLSDQGCYDRIAFYKENPKELLESNMIQDVWKCYSSAPYQLINVVKQVSRPITTDTLNELIKLLPKEDPDLSFFACLETPFASRMIRQTYELLSKKVTSLTLVTHIFNGGPTRIPVLLDELARLLFVESSCW